MNASTRATASVSNITAKAADTTNRNRIAIVIALALIAAIAPAFIYPIFLMKLMCFALFACSFNLLLGHTGLLSFGHAVFFGMGSYACAYVLKFSGLTPEFGLLAGTATGLILGAVFGALAIRREGIYFAMITLALGQLVYFLAIQNDWFTGGEDGIQGVPRGKMFGIFDLSNDMTLYVAVTVCFLLSLIFIIRVVQSPFGEVLRAVRDNGDRATSLGYHVNRYKLVTFVLSAGLAGFAGSFKGLVFQVATLSDVHWSTSGQPIIMTLIGGLGTVFGPVVGASVFLVSESYLTFLGSWVLVVQGAVFFFCVLFFRQGLVGILPEKFRRWL